MFSLDFNKIFSKIFYGIEKFFPHLLTASIILAIGWWLSGKLTKIICKTLDKARVDLGIISFSKSILKSTIRIIVLLTALSEIGVNITSLIAALGAAFVAVGIALKDSLSNIASGVIIIVNKPFKIGDYLEIDELFGTVKKIELIFTTLTTPDNKEIIIPNSKLVSSSIINCNKKSIRRLDLIYPLKSTLGVEKIKSLFNKVVSNNSKILKEPSFKILIDSYNFEKTEFRISLWCKTNDYASLKNEINEQVLTSFEEENLVQK